MKNYVLMGLTIASLGLSGCFLAGLGIGAVGGGAAMHAYDTKPAPTPVAQSRCYSHDPSGTYQVPCGEVE